MGIKLSDITDKKLRDRIAVASNPFTERYAVDFLAAPTSKLLLVIKGQIRGGKNNMIVTRSGHHFPKKSWAIWRDQAVLQVRSQLRIGFVPFDQPVLMRLDYVAGDRIRRDMPAIVDSLFHVLEKAGVVTDDNLIWVEHSTRKYDKSNPHAKMEIYQ